MCVRKRANDREDLLAPVGFVHKVEVLRLDVLRGAGVGDAGCQRHPGTRTRTLIPTSHGGWVER